jgi:hypothetical protein
MAYTPETTAARISDKPKDLGSSSVGQIHVPELTSSNAIWKQATGAGKGTEVACGTSAADGMTYRCPIFDSPDKPAVKNAKTLGTNWDQAYKEKDFSQSNADIAAAARDVYGKGGMAGVKQLEKGINDAAVTSGYGIALVPDGADKMKILNGSYVSDKKEGARYGAEYVLGKEDQLKSQGIYRVNGGFFKTIPDSTESFKLKQ